MYNQAFEPLARAMPPQAFNILNEARGFLNSQGEMDVPADHHGYVIYGPYWPMSPGRYIVGPELSDAEIENTSYGRLEICDKGVVLASSELLVGAALNAVLPAIEGLEIRIRAIGVAFRLMRVILVHVPDFPGNVSAGEASSQETSLAALEALLAGDGKLGRRKMPRDLSPEKRFEALAELIQSSADADLVTQLSEGLAFEHDFEVWLKARTPARVYDVWGGHLRANAAALLGMGFDLTAMRLASDDGFTQAVSLAEDQAEMAVAAALSVAGEASRTPMESAWLRKLQSATGAFGRLTTALGYACTICPFTGETRTSQHAIVVPQESSKQAFVFYKFESVSTFYIVTAGFSASKAFLYVPSRNVVLRLHEPSFEWGTPESAVARFVELATRYAGEVARYISQPTRLAVLCGTVANLGHFFWNEVSGLLDTERDGLLSGRFVPVIARYGFIDPFALLDRAPKGDTLRFGDDDALFLGVLRANLMCVRLCSAEVSDRVAEKVHDYALRHSGTEAAARISQALDSDYLLWVGARNHNKVWLERFEGIERIVTHIMLTHARVVVFVDGTIDCAEELEEIRRRLPQTVRVYSGIGVPLEETILWAFNIDAYITTIGSGLVIPTWLAAKPGVAHSETHHLHQMNFWGKVRAAAPLPLAPFADQVYDQSPHGYCDYSVSSDVMLELFRRLPKQTPRLTPAGIASPLMDIK